MNEKAVLSVKEMAAFLGISETVAYRLTHSEGFPVLCLGKRRLIPVDGLKNWIAEQSRTKRGNLFNRQKCL